MYLILNNWQCIKFKHPLEYAAPPTPKPATPRSIPPPRTTEAPLSSTENVKRALFQDQITGETVTGQEVCDASTEIIASEHKTSNAIEDTSTTIQLAATPTDPQASTSQLPMTSTPVSDKKSFIQLLSNTLMKRQDAAPKAGKPNRKRTHNQSVILTCDAILKDLEEPTTSEPKQKDQKRKQPQNLQQYKDLLHRQIQHLHPRLKLWNLTIHLL